MATIKSYTDLEQSKKLAEFLPIESADMFYDGIQDLHKEKVYNIPIDGSSITVRTGHIITKKDIKANLLLPCWSLAALLEQLPCEICDDEGNSANISIYKEKDKYQLVYNSSFYEDFDDIETDFHENLVDACVAMIESLHELNLL